MATTASWHKSRHKKEIEDAESMGSLVEMQSAKPEKSRERMALRTWDRIGDQMKESTSKEHDSSTAEKRARACRAKRRA